MPSIALVLKLRIYALLIYSILLRVCQIGDLRFSEKLRNRSTHWRCFGCTLAKATPQLTRFTKRASSRFVAKLFPWLNRWSILFGTDRATGNTTVDVDDAYNDLHNPSKKVGSNRGLGRGLNDSHTARSKDPIDLDEEVDDATSINPPSIDAVGSSKSTTKRRRSSNIDGSQIKVLMNELMESAQVTINSSAGQFVPMASSSTSTPANNIAVKQDVLYDALISLEDLSKEEVTWAAHYLANNRGDHCAFYGMPVDVWSTFVRSLRHFVN